MKQVRTGGPVEQYKKINVISSIEDANPHRLIQMLMQGALEKIAIAKGFMERKDVANKGANITWAISIVEGLRTSLNTKDGGELAQNLEDMYEYIIRRLLRANLENDVFLLDEVSGLLLTIKSAWDKLPHVLSQNEILGPDSTDVAS